MSGLIKIIYFMTLANWCKPFHMHSNMIKKSSFMKMSTTTTEGISEIKMPVAKVPKTAWRWPPGWPFPEDFLAIVPSVVKESGSFTEDAQNKVTEHLTHFLADGSAVLEIGFDDKTIIPSSKSLRKLSKVFVTENSNNEAKTRIEINMNSDFSLPFQSNEFDYVIFSTGIEYLANPRDNFREIYRILKPGGLCFVSFSTKPNTENMNSVKMWTTMNDEQKIWIVGSYFHYSAFEGWDSIEGYDVAGLTGNKEMVFEKDRPLTGAAYVVQAMKKVSASLEEDVEAFVTASMFNANNVDPEDRKFLSMRLTTECNTGDLSTYPAEIKEKKLLELISKMPQLYSILKDVKELVLPRPVKAMLAVFAAPNWLNTPRQREALSMGVGLLPPDEIFWNKVAPLTAQLGPRDRIILLSDLLPLFAFDESLQEDISTTGSSTAEAGLATATTSTVGPVLLLVPDLLSELIDAIESKLRGADKADIQLLATDLIASDFVLPVIKLTENKLEGTKAIAAKLIKFVKEASEKLLSDILSERKNALVAKVV